MEKHTVGNFKRRHLHLLGGKPCSSFDDLLLVCANPLHSCAFGWPFARTATQFMRALASSLAQQDVCDGLMLSASPLGTEKLAQGSV